MTFASPLHLLALAAIPLVMAAYRAGRSRRGRHALRFPGTAVLAGAAPRRPWLARALSPALLAAAAATLAVAFADPQTTVAVPVEKASVTLVTDESGSMAATDVAPSRLAAAQSAARSFLDRVPGQLAVGFVGYSSQTNVSVEPTTDRDRVMGALAGLQPDGGTATGDALNTALDRLAARRGRDGRRAPAAVILLSDGKTNVGSDPLAAAQRARRLGIPVFTVALGTPDGTVLGPGGEAYQVPPDPETLQEISRISRGRFAEVTDAGTLEDVYRRLGSTTGVRHVQRPVATSFAAGGLVLLLAGLGTGLRRRGRLV